jgi:hypothetical protein
LEAYQIATRGRKGTSTWHRENATDKKRVDPICRPVRP